MKKNEVTYIHVPNFDELSAKRLWPDLKEDKKFNIYFNDKYAQEKAPCREYFFNILNSVYPEYVTKIVTHALKQRNSAEGEEN